MRRAQEQLEKVRADKKQEWKKELMKDINPHRRNKINIFTREIEETQGEISKLKEYRGDPANADMEYYYTSSIDEK